MLLLFLIFNTCVYSQNNLLRAVAINYITRSIGDGYNLDFNNPLKQSNADMEFDSGNQWEAFQPVGIIQNVSDKVLTFKARIMILNLDVNKKIYNKIAPVSHECLLVGNNKEQSCYDDPYIKASYIDVDYKDNYYNVEYLPYPGVNNLKGIPPGGYAEIYFSPFEANPFFENHIGNCSVSLIVIPINPDNGDTLDEQYFNDDTLKLKLKLRELECSELYYPNDGDTVKNGNNYYYGMGHQKNYSVFTIEFSKRKDFKNIEFTRKGTEAYDIKFTNNDLYFWRLRSERQDTICYSEVRSFYVEDVNLVKEEKDIFGITPNPATNFITINLQPSEGSMVEIYDMLGVKVISELIHQMTSRHLMNIENLSAGLYFIKIGSRVEKFVKI